MNANSPFDNKIYKLSTGEEVLADVVENLIEKTCHYVKYALVRQNDKNETVAFLFPNSSLYAHPDYVLTTNEGCFCPRSLAELGKCMTGCLKLINFKLAEGDDKLKAAVLANSDSSLAETGGMSYHELVDTYKALLTKRHGPNVSEEDEIYFIKNI
ncbi:MAG: hypothetical protein PSX36_01705 [bacterium]|nr:hypothetical protein [bacterium]